MRRLTRTFNYTLDGQQLGIHELKPGMKLVRATVTTSTPQVVTTVQTVTGKVWQVTPPPVLILTLENGQNQGLRFQTDRSSW